MRCLDGFPDIEVQVVFRVYPLASVEFQKPVGCEYRVASIAETGATDRRLAATSSVSLCSWHLL